VPVRGPAALAYNLVHMALQRVRGTLGARTHEQASPMRCGFPLLLLLAATQLCAAPLREQYTVLAGGNPVGHLKVEHEGDRIAIDYDYKNNGRGPTMTESLRLDARGLPVEWKIEGATTFGSRVDESFELVDGQARWRDSVGEGSAQPDQASLYIGQSASPWALGLYARALLKAEGGRLPALPGGEVRVQAGESVEIGEGDARRILRFYSVGGLELNPDYFLLDEDGEFFGVVSPRFAVIRSGYEEQARALGERAHAIASARLELIQRETAQHFEGPIRIRNVRVFEPQNLALSAPRDVLVYRDRIASVQPAGSPSTPGEVLIEGEGGTLLPGFYEMHGHIGQEGATLNIAAGITSVRDMGNDNASLRQLIDRIEAGELAGPRIHPSGYIEGRSPFNSNNGRLVASEAEGIDAVRWYAARGFHQIKLYNSINPAWSQALVAEAHRLGMRATGHVPAFANADAMIEAGYDELTHINQILLGWVLSPEEDTRTLLRLTALKRLGGLDLSSPRVKKTMDAIVAREVAVEPTIAIHENLLLNQDGEIPRGMRDWFEHLPIGTQRDSRRAWADMSGEGDAAAYAAAWEVLMNTLREMHARGVLLIPGTDLGGSFAYHRELQLFEQLGMSPAQVLSRATLEMARYLGEDQQLGSIERGKRADFFLVPGDPTADLRETLKVRMVVKDGVVYFPEWIHAYFGIRPLATAPELVVPTAE
jgi:imidazolonepropionase-like amidohydrolase